MDPAGSGAGAGAPPREADASPTQHSRYFGRPRAAGRGVGLGLAIAARQAAVLGAELHLSNAPGGGAVARLCFDVGAGVGATCGA